MAGDRCIQLSYRVRLAILKHAEMLQKSNARDLAHIRETGHFFRFVFADDLSDDRNARILWEMARPTGLEPVTPGLEDRYAVPLSYGRRHPSCSVVSRRPLG
jgi:hypothetical protein